MRVLCFVLVIVCLRSLEFFVLLSFVLYWGGGGGREERRWRGVVFWFVSLGFGIFVWVLLQKFHGAPCPNSAVYSHREEGE